MNIEKTEDPNQIIITVPQLNKDAKSFIDFQGSISSFFNIDLQKLETKYLFSTSSSYVQFFKELNWFLFLENNTLYRFDMKFKKKEFLRSFADYPSFRVFDNASIFVDVNSYPSFIDILLGKINPLQSTKNYYLMRPDGQWLKINDLFQNQILQDVSLISHDSFLLSLARPSNGIKRVIKWNPNTYTKKTILEIKDCVTIGISKLDHRFNTYSQIFPETQLEQYFQFNVQINNNENQVYLYDRLSDELKRAPVLEPADKELFTIDKLMMVFEGKNISKRLFLISWSNLTSKSFKIDFSEKTHSKTQYGLYSQSPDKTYLLINGFDNDDQSDKKLWFVNVQTGKELTFPESKDFQFITWLEEK